MHETTSICVGKQKSKLIDLRSITYQKSNLRSTNIIGGRCKRPLRP
jgi:hypothetical protein